MPLYKFDFLVDLADNDVAFRFANDMVALGLQVVETDENGEPTVMSGSVHGFVPVFPPEEEEPVEIMPQAVADLLFPDLNEQLDPEALEEIREKLNGN